ncbi:Oidioi.mRNA.OKI2018_I69.chr1.g2454.t1.cds [Oikopleura dioica]|uniref:Oidioi.mRNA.OKI2018_I69.chr1.g2454.t1.cds n=1 Tax=Oikopleura dioica TaxID=34765 RepID=A0ABN7SUN8_OIKDI|nr:Oidioi.mRNA.OKI2018_I69.chr1.g2454.t1.cds [Oikopleura dioica]
MSTVERKSRGQSHRPAPYSMNEALTKREPRLLIRNIPKDCTQTDLIPLIPVQPTEIKAIEFLKKTDMTPAGAAVVVLASYSGMSKAALADGRELRGHNLWAVKDVEGMRSLSLLQKLGHKNDPAAASLKKPSSSSPVEPVEIPAELMQKVDLTLLNNIKAALSTLSGETKPAPVDTVRQRSVKVRNLPDSASYDRISQVFLGCGTIESISEANYKNEVIIKFTTADEADLAVRFYNGRRMDGKRLQVLYRDR